MEDRRPVGLAILAVLLCWCGVGALLMAVTRPQMASPLTSVSPVFRVAAALYAMVAFPTAAGIWRQSSWALAVYRVWACATVAIALLPSLAVPPRSTSEVAALGVATVTGAVLLWQIGSYVRDSATNKQPR